MMRYLLGLTLVASAAGAQKLVTFSGTVVAPHAELRLGSVPNSVYRGAFFGRRVVVAPGTLVEFAEH